MSDQHSASHPIEPPAAAAYIAEIVSSLAAIARRHKFDALGYLLEMARLEAETLSSVNCSREFDHGNDSSQGRSHEA